MAKRKATFDHGPFGTKHNSLFRPGPAMRLNACVGRNREPAGFDRYASGYFEAGARLVASLKENSVSVDSLIYPLVMLYRHGIETALKHLVRVLPSLCDDDAEVKLTHNLIDNWKIARRYLAELDAGDEGLDEVEAILKDFVELDPRGDAFRYPEDIKGKRLLQDTSLINVEVFGERMELVAKHLEGCCYWADHLEEAKAEGLRWELEMEQDHARDMADYYGDESW
ncbi:hypothetical protein [Anatilimnocola floriformis]|uniref:hypothetical protein n=1 Tax=Anatilimnocola floriformis TaxID=2948575 RepID=UPI0020C22DCC|nr:hypothetical protein [Anatilimnocola floriformis]